RALCAKPQVLLADEPLASLDPTNAARVLQLFTRLQERHGFALVVSLHDWPLAQTEFARICFLNNGVLQEQTSEQMQQPIEASGDGGQNGFSPQYKDSDHHDQELPFKDVAVA